MRSTLFSVKVSSGQISRWRRINRVSEYWQKMVLEFHLLKVCRTVQTRRVLIGYPFLVRFRIPPAERTPRRGLCFPYSPVRVAPGSVEIVFLGLK